jgi:hypothetical protein
MYKKKKNESMDLLTNNIKTFANIANNCVTELCPDKEKETKEDFYEMELKYIPEGYELPLMMSDSPVLVKKIKKGLIKKY